MSYGTIKKLPSVSEEGASKFPSTTLSSPGVEVTIKEEDFFGLGGHRPRAQTIPPCMRRKGIAGRVLKFRISSDHMVREEGMRIVVTNPDGIDFDPDQRNDSK